MSKCQNFECDAEALRTIKIPSVSGRTSRTKPMVFGYCHWHADEVLAEPDIFPGAEEVVVVEC